jgi:LPXTG-motif cell wall-anchored protein
MGTPTTAAGAFSVDLIAWLCLPTAGGEHTITLRDQFALPRPGETELRIEDSPGIRVGKARLGLIDLADHDARWQGAGGPIAHDGLTLTFTADDARPIGGGVCAGVASSGARTWPWLVGAGLAIAAAGGAAVGLRRRKRRRRK